MSEEATPPKGEMKLFDEALLAFLERIPEFKSKMLKRKLLLARVRCPKCKGKLLLELRGSKNHLWASCTQCKFRMIE